MTGDYGCTTIMIISKINSWSCSQIPHIALYVVLFLSFMWGLISKVIVFCKCSGRFVFKVIVFLAFIGEFISKVIALLRFISKLFVLDLMIYF